MGNTRDRIEEIRERQNRPDTAGDAGDIAALLAEVARLKAQIAPLQEFFWHCWDYARGFGGELDGGDIQEWGEKGGLLQKVVANAPCGEGCVCADYVGDDFPTDCYRPTVARVSRLTEEPK